MAAHGLLRQAAGEDIESALRRMMKDCKSVQSPLTSHELKTVLRLIQQDAVSDSVREWVESELLCALDSPQLSQDLGQFSFCAWKAKLSPRVVDSLAGAMIRQFSEIRPRALCTLVNTIASLRVNTEATNQLVEATTAQLENFSPKDASLFVRALTQIPNAPLDAAWPHIVTNLERSEWPGRDLGLLCHVLTVARNDDVAMRLTTLLPTSKLAPVDIVHALGLYGKMPQQGPVAEVVQFLLNELKSSDTQMKLSLDGFAGLCLTLSRLGKLQDYVDLSRVKASLNTMGPSHLCVIGNAARMASYDAMLDLLAPRVISARREFREPRHFANGMMAYKKRPEALEALVSHLLARHNAGTSSWERFSRQEIMMMANGSQACEVAAWWDRLTTHIQSRRDWKCSELIQLGNACLRSRHAKNMLDYVVTNIVVNDMQLVDASMLLTCLWKTELHDAALTGKIWKHVEVLLSSMTKIEVHTFNGLLLSSKNHDLPQAALLGIAEKVWGSAVEQWASIIGWSDEDLFRALLPAARTACASLNEGAREKFRRNLARAAHGAARETMVLT